MNTILKENPEQIEKELYQFLGIKKEDFEDNVFISKISNDFFIFQQEILNLINNQFSISFKRKTFHFNNVLKIHDYGKKDVPSKLILRYDSFNNEDELESNFISWSSGTGNEITALHPEKVDHINIFGKTVENYYLLQPIRIYFFNQLFELSNVYFQDINTLKNFLIPFNTILNQLNKVNYEIDNIIPKEKLHSSSLLFDILNKNNEIKDIVSLYSDFDINPYLELIKEYNKTNIKKIKLK